MLWRGVAAGISQTVQTTMVTRKAKSRLITWSSLYSTLEHFHRHATENETARDAVRADVKAQRMSLWSSSGAQVALDIPFLGDVGIVSWSPDARHLAIVPDADRVDAIYFAGFDQPASRFVPGGLVFDLEWRGADELSFFSASSRDYPISGATLWDWRAGERPQALVKLDLAGWSAWRSDGAVFAYPAVTADGTAAVRTLDVTGTATVGDRTVLTADDVTRSKVACSSPIGRGRRRTSTSRVSGPNAAG